MRGLRVRGTVRGVAIAAFFAIVLAAIASTATASPSQPVVVGHGFDLARSHLSLGFSGIARPPSGTVGDPVATGLNAPFGLSTDASGHVLVAEAGIGGQDAAPGRILQVSHGQLIPLFTGPPFASDVDSFESPQAFRYWSRWGSPLNAFNSYAYTFGAPTNILGVVSGRTTRTFDLGAFEAANNPDQINTYGPTIDIQALVGPTCWNSLNPALQQVASQYTGVVDSDAFRTTFLPDGSRAVADAAGNDIVDVSPNGNISTLVVLPPNVVHVGKDVLSGPLTDEGDTFPDCVLDALPADGIDYRFEPVPTGIAVGPDGNLYVALLPGGEIPGAAKIMRVNIYTGQIDTFAAGFSDVTDIAFVKGSLYLTELFNGDIVKIPTSWSGGNLVAGTPSVLATVPLPNGLTAGLNGTLYASIQSLTTDGQVVPITP